MGRGLFDRIDQIDRHRIRRLASETGSTMPLIALGVTVIFGFAALAVDVGTGYAEVRRSQNAADAAVMAGIVENLVDLPTVQGMVSNAVSYASANVPGGIPLSDWVDHCPETDDPSEQLAWTAAEMNLTPETDCISFSAGFERMRVTLPDRSVDAFFAPVIGIDSYEVSASAEARTAWLGLAMSPPFVVVDGTSAGDTRCFRAPAIAAIEWPAIWVGNGVGVDPSTGDESDPDEADPCDDTVFDTDSQFFGSLKAYEYATCTQPSGNNAIGVVIADGIDHILGSHGNYAVGDPERIDGDGCPSGPPQGLPDTMELQTGYTAKVLMLGMLTSDQATPRLQRGPHVQSDYQFAERDIDNTPLWEYLRSDMASVNAPTACKTVYAEKDNPQYDVFDLKELMVECLKKWHNNPSDDIIFADLEDTGSPSITTSARFAWVPMLDETSLAGLDGKLVHFNTFVPVFMNTLYQINRKQSQSADCWSKHSEENTQFGLARHDAGQEFDCGFGGNNAELSALSAIVLPCGALPADVCIDDSVAGGPGGQPVARIELSG